MFIGFCRESTFIRMQWKLSGNRIFQQPFRTLFFLVFLMEMQDAIWHENVI